MVYTLDTRTGYEAKDSAVHELLYRVASVRSYGGGVLAVEHDEDKLRVQIRRMMRILKRENKVKCILFGERVEKDEAILRYMVDMCPDFTGDPRIGSPTVSFVLV